MDLSNHFSLHLVCPGVDLCPPGGFADGGVIRVMTALFGRDQFGDVAHDLMTDLVQLGTAITPGAGV